MAPARPVQASRGTNPFDCLAAADDDNDDGRGEYEGPPTPPPGYCAASPAGGARTSLTSGAAVNESVRR